MTETRLRAILAKELRIEPDEITDATSTETVKAWDSLVVMNLVFAIEAETDLHFADDVIATLTTWPNLKGAVFSGSPVALIGGIALPFRKVLVLDADDTLWEGIAGEGGAFASDMALERQAAYLRLKRRGVLLAVASKNEPGTVEAILRTPEMLLDPKDFVAIEEGWGDKPSMLRRIAEKLNVGLDSLVFVDNSDFELYGVGTQLPMVAVHPPSYDLESLFPKLIDTSKTEQYHALAAAEKTRPLFASENEYLASLGMKVEIHLNRPDEIERIAELTQKSNQFNLTTIRYTVPQIFELMGFSNVYSIHVADRFGDQGLVGVLILRGSTVEVFLLSCRVLGRGVEYSIWEALDPGPLVACYIPTEKNAQVADFWDRVGLFPANPGPGGIKSYMGVPTVKGPSWIEVSVA